MRIRTATAEDVSLIFAFIQQKSQFDREIGAYRGVLQVTEEKLCKTLFGKNPFAHVIFAGYSGGEVGFALYAFRYSSFVGQPNLWLDDLYVNESQRGLGAGAMLMDYLAQVARIHDCTHLAWTADARNIRGLSFYARLGAQVSEQIGHQCFLKWEPVKEA
jgi:GNAT superfamily N-acetyltransferase